jgi:hypothetical protein
VCTVQNIAVEFSGDSVDFGSVVSNCTFGVDCSIKIRSCVGVPLPICIGIDKRNMRVQTVFYVVGGPSQQSVVLGPYGTHEITLRAEPRGTECVVDGDCTLVVGVGSARLVREVPLRINVVPLKFSMEYGDGVAIYDCDSYVPPPLVKLKEAELGFVSVTPLWILNDGDVEVRVLSLRFESNAVASPSGGVVHQAKLGVSVASICVAPGEVGRVDLIVNCKDVPVTTEMVSVSGKLEVFVQHLESPLMFRVSAVGGSMHVTAPNISIVMEASERELQPLLNPAHPRRLGFVTCNALFANSGNIPITVTFPCEGTLRAPNPAGTNPHAIAAVTLSPGGSQMVALEMWPSSVDDVDGGMTLATSSYSTPYIVVPFSVRFKRPFLKLLRHAIDIGGVPRHGQRSVTVPLSNVGAAPANYWVKLNTITGGPFTTVRVQLDGALIDDDPRPQVVYPGKVVDGLSLELTLGAAAVHDAEFSIEVAVHSTGGAAISPDGDVVFNPLKETFVVHGFVVGAEFEPQPAARRSIAPIPVGDSSSWKVDATMMLGLLNSLLKATTGEAADSELRAVVEAALLPASVARGTVLRDLCDPIVDGDSVEALLSSIQSERCVDGADLLLLKWRTAVARCLASSAPPTSLAKAVCFWSQLLSCFSTGASLCVAMVCGVEMTHYGVGQSVDAVWDAGIHAISAVPTAQGFMHYIESVCCPLRNAAGPAALLVFQRGQQFLASSRCAANALSVDALFRYIEGAGLIAPDGSTLQRCVAAVHRALRCFLRYREGTVRAEDVLHAVLTAYGDTDLKTSDGGGIGAGAGIACGGESVADIRSYSGARGGIMRHGVQLSDKSALSQHTVLAEFLVRPRCESRTSALVLRLSPVLRSLVLTIQQRLQSPIATVLHCLHKSTRLAPGDLYKLQTEFVDMATEALDSARNNGWQQLFRAFGAQQFSGWFNVQDIPSLFVKVGEAHHRKLRRKASVALLMAVVAPVFRSASDPGLGDCWTTMSLLRRILLSKADAARALVAKELLPERSHRVAVTSSRECAVDHVIQVVEMLVPKLDAGNVELAVLELGVLLHHADCRLMPITPQLQAITAAASNLFSCLKGAQTPSINCLSAANKFLGVVDHVWKEKPLGMFATTLAAHAAQTGSARSVPAAALLLKSVCPDDGLLWSTLDAIEKVRLLFSNHVTPTTVPEPCGFLLWLVRYPLTARPCILNCWVNVLDSLLTTMLGASLTPIVGPAVHQLAPWMLRELASA